MIKLENVNVIYNYKTNSEFCALKNINLHLLPNNLLILKGISGSGKSTLLSLIAGFIKPTSGKIVVNNKNIAKLSDLHISNFRLHEIGFIFQSFNLFDNLTVEENVNIPTIPLKLSKKERFNKIENSLKLANIFDKRKQIVKNLSGGEKQRVAIARAVVNNPPIILCDEPTANLDKENSILFIQLLKKLKKLNKNIIVATHDPLFESLDFSDQIIKIDNKELQI